MLALLCSILVGSGAVSAELVRDVVVVARPDDVERLLGYVTVRAGEPLSRAAVRDSVALLHATGAFADVIVESQPFEGGLQITFRPVPLPRLRRIVVEGDEVLKPGELRRITGLSRSEPLWDSRLEEAAQDAAVALADKGYLEARVTAEARPMAEGADAVFTIRAGPLAHVRQLRLEGLAGHEIWDLPRRMRPRPGQPYDRARADSARESIRKELVARGRWMAEVELRPVYDPAFARIDLTFWVDPRAPVKVEFRGAEVPRALRGEIATLLRDGAVKTDALEDATDRLERHFRRHGHRDAVVSYTEEARIGQLAVVYTIEAGPRTTVASARLLGADVPEVQLQTRPGAPLEDRLLDADTALISEALEARGYPSPRVEADVPEGGGQVPVLFRVRAGPKTFVASYDIDFPRQEVATEAAVPLRVQVGEAYRLRDLALDRNALLAAYRNAGYLDAEIEPEVEFSDDRTEARVRLSVSPGPRTDVGRIVIAGLERTRESVIRRELTIREGDPLSLQRVLESQRRLGALGILSRVEIRELDPEAVAVRDLIILAEEAPETTVAYGIGYGERELLRASAEVTRRNLGGQDQSLTVFARGSFRGSRFMASYRVPYVFGRRRELFVTGFREEDDRESFDFVRQGALVQTAFGLSGKLNLILRYSYQQTDTFNETVPCQEVDRQYCDSTVSGPSGSVVNDSRDDPLDPRNGHFLGADIQLSHKLLGGDSFLRGYLQARAYAPVGSRVLFALNGRVGLARTLGLGEPLRLPLPERFFAGGDYSLRGFDVDSVDPEGGNAMLLGGLEARVDLASSFSAAAFLDLGNVYTLVSDIDLGDLRYSAGLGVRYKTALGPLRVDWAHKLNRRPGESASRWHFTIGHAF